MDKQKIALVTGSNRGIGSEIVRQLAQKKDITVVMTSRDEKKGKQLFEKYKNDGLNVDYRVLDVANPKSIDECVESIVKAYGRIDILVNNAGIFPDTKSNSADAYPSFFETSIETMRRGMETNVYGPMLLCQRIIPHMKKNNYGRIVNMSSGMGQLSEMNGGCPAYRVSKTSLNVLTRILADELKETNILVNSMHPGWVKTDMGGPNATRELPQGADTAIFLATLPDGGLSGQFFRDRKQIPW
ncbi:MAG: SDR family oxidoreductase [Candidatus Omnitrophica bacterium]|nr:SDR family oxidoreductase [Candidatus Omnitrophota bacterium]